jgi:FG-GAP-like repeat
VRITLVPDSSIASAPAGLTAAVEAAADVFERDFPGNYNVNISYGWGTFNNVASNVLTNPGSAAFSVGGGPLSFVSYSDLKGWLTANAASSAQLTAVASLPASAASLPGAADGFAISPAQKKALGVFTGNSSAIDGSIGFNIADASLPAAWEPAALCEIAHALGWDSLTQGGSIPDVADLFRYSSPGERQWTSGQPAYFSIDGGNTRLADFSTTFDTTLFTNLPADDPLRLPFTSAATTLTSFDIEALSVIGFGVASAGPPPLPRRFNSGGNSPDILWQRANGQASIWEMNGTSVTGGGPISGNPGPNWNEVATGDFNGDGHSDILWQSVSGQASVWDMSGENVISGGLVSPNPGASWQAIGTGDFNGDGHSDILWQSTSTGQVSIWEMSGNNVIGGGTVSLDPGPNWRAVGAGDFDDDGHSDILWQNANGQTSIWEMNGTSVVGGGPLASNPGPSWSALGTGDFNDDKHSDILWRNSNGQVSIWEMNGTNLVGGGPIASNPGLNWAAVGAGDFNQDGYSDILWQNTNGQTSIWEMNGIRIIGGGPVGPNPGADWRAI